MARRMSYEDIYSTTTYLAECATNVFNVRILIEEWDDTLCIVRIGCEWSFTRTWKGSSDGFGSYQRRVRGMWSFFSMSMYVPFFHLSFIFYSIDLVDGEDEEHLLENVNIYYQKQTVRDDLNDEELEHLRSIVVRRSYEESEQHLCFVNSRFECSFEYQSNHPNSKQFGLFLLGKTVENIDINSIELLRDWFSINYRSYQWYHSHSCKFGDDNKQGWDQSILENYSTIGTCWSHDIDN